MNFQTETRKSYLKAGRNILIVTITGTCILLFVEYFLKIHFPESYTEPAFAQAIWTIFHITCGMAIGVMSVSYAVEKGKKVISY